MVSAAAAHTTLLLCAILHAALVPAHAHEEEQGRSDLFPVALSCLFPLLKAPQGVKHEEIKASKKLKKKRNPVHNFPCLPFPSLSFPILLFLRSVVYCPWVIQSP